VVELLHKIFFLHRTTLVFQLRFFPNSVHILCVLPGSTGAMR